MNHKVRQVAVLGMFFALALVLSFLEGLLPPIPMLPPGIKLGLSNIVTMYCLLYLGKGSAYLLAVLKAGFAFLTRGSTAGFLSLCGGVLAITVMVVLMLPKRYIISVFLLSVSGAVGHNIGQLAGSVVLIGGFAAFAYLPVLLLAGVVMGAVTGIILKTVLPAVERFHFPLQKQNER